jgi:hypothetical protein
MRFLRFIPLFALLFAAPAAAQVAVQQSGTHLDASTLACGYSAAFAVAQQSTTTCTPQAGQFVYITTIAFDACNDATGTAVTPATFTSTNIPGLPTFGVAMVTQATYANPCWHWQVVFPSPVKSTAAGTAVTIVSPATAAHTAWQATVFGYSAP